MNFRFHVLGIPHTVSSKVFNACAYTQKIVKFCKMMKSRGHYVMHYGHEDSEVMCDEHVTVVTNEDFEISYGSHDWRKNFFKFDMNDHAYLTFFKNAIDEVGKRKIKNDFILPFWGQGVKPVCDAHSDLIVVEPGIGYAHGHWANWKVFESYAIYHAYCGLKNVGMCNQSWYDIVIPNYFDPEDFVYSDEKEDYFLYLGRVYDGKGVNIAIQATEIAGEKLIIAGQKDGDYPIPSHVEYIGYADVETRKRLMSKARASFLPSIYVEPFGGVQVENLLSGTPTITTDWGAFAENNLHGITGYRCRTMGDFVQAVKNIDKINPIDCRVWGENFLMDRIAPMYENYFSDIMNVKTGAGWYSEKDSSVLFALEKQYPKYKPFNTDSYTEKNNFKNNYIIKIEKSSTDTELCEMLNKYGSDKGSSGHNYSKFYYDIFKNIKYEYNNIFELGIGTSNPKLPSTMGVNYLPGASLRSWRSFFPFSKIYGADIDKEILFEDDRIKTYYVNQTDESSIENLWKNDDLKYIEFDIMIDDGLHECLANINFLINSIYKLRDGGIYIVEDVQYSQIGMFQKSLEENKNKINFKFEYDFKIINSGYPVASTDNCLLLIRRIKA